MLYVYLLEIFMLNSVFDFMTQMDSFFWGYIAFVLIIVLGVWLSIKAGFFQVLAFPAIVKTFLFFLKKSGKGERGVHPLQAFFASVGGMIGIGNVVGVVTAVQVGGPGALFWVWIAALIGAIIKYSEIFLGLKFRVKNDQGGYDGGPMYFLKNAFNNRWIPTFIAALLCIYGIEIYQFVVITDSLSLNFDLNRYFIIATLLIAVMYASVGGVSRVGKICSWIMPFFMGLYLLMSLWVILSEIAILPEILKSVFASAFTGHAAVGGFAGSTALLAIQHGISRAAYSADLGIGYDSIIQSESNTIYPERQARLAVLGVCFDNLVCTMSILVVLLSGIWKSENPIEGSQLVQTALGQYFPYMNIFMPIFFLIVGYSTMISYCVVGIKCARFLYPKYGSQIYLVYGVVTWIIFSFFDQSQALLVMSISGAILLITNLTGIFMLRHHIEFPKGSKSEILKAEG